MGAMTFSCSSADRSRVGQDAGALAVADLGDVRAGLVEVDVEVGALLGGRARRRGP